MFRLFEESRQEVFEAERRFHEAKAAYQAALDAFGALPQTMELRKEITTLVERNKQRRTGQPFQPKEQAANNDNDDEIAEPKHQDTLLTLLTTEESALSNDIDTLNTIRSFIYQQNPLVQGICDVDSI
jgi:hypothetical protein